jgi:hypothetical protein
MLLQFTLHIHAFRPRLFIGGACLFVHPPTQLVGITCKLCKIECGVECAASFAGTFFDSHAGADDRLTATINNRCICVTSGDLYNVDGFFNLKKIVKISKIKIYQVVCLLRECS